MTRKGPGVTILIPDCVAIHPKFVHPKKGAMRVPSGDWSGYTECKGGGEVVI